MSEEEKTMDEKFQEVVSTPPEEKKEEKEEKEEKPESVKEIIKNNYKKTATVIATAIGETIMKLWSIAIFSFKLGLDFQSTMFFILMTMTPYMSIIVNSLFKGETKDAEVENKILEVKRQSQAREARRMFREMRDYMEVCATLAARDGMVPEAIRATDKWLESNDELTENGF